MVFSIDELEARHGLRRIVLTDEAPDDNSKDLVYSTDVGVGTSMTVDLVRVEYVATGTVGTRTPVLEHLDSEGNVIASFETSGTVTVGATKNIQWMMLGRNSLTFGTTNWEDMAVAPVLLPGQTLRVRDSANIDANDDLSVHVHGWLQT